MNTDMETSKATMPQGEKRLALLVRTGHNANMVATVARETKIGSPKARPKAAIVIATIVLATNTSRTRTPDHGLPPDPRALVAVTPDEAWSR